MVTIRKNDFEFLELPYSVKTNFKVCKELSSFHAKALKWVGDAIRQPNSQEFWNGNRYCWYTDKTQKIQQCVYQTENGILMFEDLTIDKLFRLF